MIFFGVAWEILATKVRFREHDIIRCPLSNKYESVHWMGQLSTNGTEIILQNVTKGSRVRGRLFVFVTGVLTDVSYKNISQIMEL